MGTLLAIKELWRTSHCIPNPAQEAAFRYVSGPGLDQEDWHAVTVRAGLDADELVRGWLLRVTRRGPTPDVSER